MNIKVMIVDDSAFMRKIISDAVNHMDGVNVVGIARNGVEALEKIPILKPDLITLDIEMPKMNGLDALKEIKRKYKVPVIMLSSQSGIDTTIEALELGAEDFIEKPKDLQSIVSSFEEELEMKIKSVACKDNRCEEKKVEPVRVRKPISNKSIKRIDAIAIAASTGGPRALVELIGELEYGFNIPIFIVQHMPKGFTKSFAERLNRESNYKVVEAEDGMMVERNTIYVAPGDYHMIVKNKRIKTNMDPKIHGVRPAADHLFKSVAEEYGGNTLGVVLTGMGKDGAEGVVDIYNAGGYNIAQSQRTCAVYGMPLNAVEKNVVDDILDLQDMPQFINKMVKGL